MALYLDSADLDHARRARDLGLVTGVTTNPALIVKTGRPGLDVLADLLHIVDGPVFYQVTADNAIGRIDQAHAAADLAPDRVVIKIPATTENLAMTAGLAAQGIRCAVTAVSHPAQAFLAGEAGAEFTIPYVNRLTRQMGDGVVVLREIAAALRGTGSRVLAASLKDRDEVAQALLNGADDVTVPLAVIETLGDHQLSNLAIEQFAAAMRDAGAVASSAGSV